MRRRSFVKSSSIALAGAAGLTPAKAVIQAFTNYGITPSLNAYSFNRALLEEGMSLQELFITAARLGFSSLDLTAYYIPGYPEVPVDEALYEIKRMAFRTGISFSGTGVRNDFTLRDPEALAREIDLVKRWIVVASKLGAPNIRVFDGKAPSSGDRASATHQQVVDAFRECSRFGARHGVHVAFQNHHDYLKSTDEIIHIMQRVDSEWFGLMLDTGSVVGSDPYLEIEKLIPYAVTWQVKETIRRGESWEELDVKRLVDLLHKHKYQGFLPIETLGEGDPRKKVQALFQKVSAYL